MEAAWIEGLLSWVKYESSVVFYRSPANIFVLRIQNII